MSILIKDLPEPYKSLAELRRDQQPDFNDNSIEKKYLKGAFHWGATLEMSDFWKAVDEGKYLDIPNFYTKPSVLIPDDAKKDFVSISVGGKTITINTGEDNSVIIKIK